jgi:hypothetical protein
MAHNVTTVYLLLCKQFVFSLYRSNIATIDAQVQSHGIRAMIRAKHRESKVADLNFGFTDFK